MESKDKINNNKNEDNKLEQNDFQDLMPIDDASLTGYKEALDRAFNDNKIKNIAITGSYGSGKSSILYTYERENPELKFIHISFLHFKECDKCDNNLNDKSDSDESDKDKIRELVLERKVINHLINQIPFKYISDTNFNVRGKIGIFKAFLKAIFTFFSICSLFYIAAFFIGKIFLDNTSIEINCMYLMVSFIFIIIYLTIFFKKLNNRRVSGSIKFKSLELNMDKLNDKGSEYNSFFDKYLDEILYIFENCRKDIIVFEDIDRLEMGVIFERLREINILLNERLKRKNRVIKFCYLVRDDIFTPEDRVKFFDFVVPIIPFVNKSNIHEMLFNYFYQFDISTTLINEVCKYISDVRMVKNIYNEFLIYNKKINEYFTPSNNQIFSIVVYKNLFPRDFNDFNLNKGLLFNILGNVPLKEKILKDIEDEIEKLNKDYKDEIRNIVVRYNMEDNENDVFNYILYYIFSVIERFEKIYSLLDTFLSYDSFGIYYCKKNNIYFDHYPNFYNYKDFFKYNFLLKSQYEILKLEYNYNCIKNNRFNKLIYKNIEELEKLFEKFNGDLVINNKSHYKFVKFLVLNGYINESSKYYLANFNSEIYEKNDLNFILNVLGENDKNLGYDYKLINVKLTVKFLDDCYYTTPNILNFDLLDYLLEESVEIRDKSIDFKLHCFLSQLVIGGNFEFLDDYYKRNIEYYKKLLNKLCYGRYKFNCIGDAVSYKELFEEVLNKNLYKINGNNLKIILEHYGYDSYDICHRNYYLINKHNGLKIYIYENFYKYFKAYLEICDGCIEDGEKYIVYLLNYVLHYIFNNYNNFINGHRKYFIKCLKVLKTKISLIKKIEIFNSQFNEGNVSFTRNGYYYKKKLFIKFYKYFFKYNSIEYVVENLFDYWLRIHEIDEDIIEFINQSDCELKFYDKCSGYEIADVRVFLDELKNDERISEEKRIEIKSCIDELDKF